MTPDDSAGARVLLAGRSETEIDDIWNARAIRTDHTTLEDLKLDLAEVRRVGWALDRVHDDGVPGVAAPVREAGGEIAAAISLNAHRLRTGCDTYRHVQLAVAAAGRISNALRAAAG
jgi:DNA-binding IclR family transcriptional regulator